MISLETLKNFSKIFSAAYLLDMLYGHNTSHFKSSYSAVQLKNSVSMKDVFNEYYKLLLNYYKNEYVYKSILIDDIRSNELQHRYALFSEMDIGKNSRLDIAHFSLSNHAYEIKTELDTFYRLEKQLLDYAKGFEYVWVVIPESKLKNVVTSVSNTIGIKLLNNNNTLVTHREAISNMDMITHGGLFSLLREKEFFTLVKKYSGHAVDLSSSESRKQYLKMFQSLGIDNIHYETINIIKNRTKYDEFHYALCNTPKYLLPIGLNATIQKEVKKIISMLNFSIDEFEDHINMMKHRKFFNFT